MNALPPTRLSGKPSPPRPVRKIRVLIVDDSITARTVLERLIAQNDSLEVTAKASTAEKALELLATIRVDVILLDLEMPGMGGLQAIPQIVAASAGARILVVSSHTVEGAAQTLLALSKGAADTFPKPTAGLLETSYRSDLIARIKELGRGRFARSRASAARPAQHHSEFKLDRREIEFVAIGASTGGIHALVQLLQGLGAAPSVPVLVTQHLPHSFMPVFARQLSEAAKCDAVVAEDGMPIASKGIVIAPGDAHLLVRDAGGRLRVRLDYNKAPNGCLPSVDPMFTSLAEEVGDSVAGVVLSGMGKDGLAGARKIIEANGRIYAQDEASSAVWGMPRAVVEAGLASFVSHPQDIGTSLGFTLGLRKQ